MGMRRSLKMKDYQRINDFQQMPKALIIKNLIKQQRMDSGVDNMMKRDAFNLVSETAAQFSTNPINAIIENQIEYGRAQSRGTFDLESVFNCGSTTNDKVV